MIIKYRGQAYRTERAIKEWLEIADKYNNQHIPVIEIAQQYKNKRTGKPYTLSYIYWILKRVQTL